MFNKESDFEEAVVKKLKEHGWEEDFKYKDEKYLLDNWAEILYQNNKQKDRLNGERLTDGEKNQLLEQIRKLNTPAELNKFINGKTISIKRDNPRDPEHKGKEISLFIYDRDEIAGGKSKYQIVRQPVFRVQEELGKDPRGDLMLLINGMPVIHIELKRTGTPVSKATNQIKRYSEKGAFTGLFSLVQVFVAMNPDECRYFANPGDADKFNDKFFFKWADKNNEPYKSWDKIITHLLSIPMAHKLIGFYTVPDDGDGVLKVLRSYQYYAVESIFNRVRKAHWTKKDNLGGYIWHTTGSGKTLTSFKAAQLLANSKLCDKVVFLMDRIELGTQAAYEYKKFADDREEIQETQNTYELKTKLKSSKISDTLIVTSIYKMSRIKIESGLNDSDIKKISKKKIVFIVDECHRTTFGDMLKDIKETFPCALYFGFTGTPILEENKKKGNTQSDLFGNELHRYSISDGIRDENVLGFDPSMVLTLKYKDIKKQLAIREAKAKTIDEVYSDPRKEKVFLNFMQNVEMAGEYKGDKYIKGVEDYIPVNQYQRDETKEIENQHQYQVVKNILTEWTTTSQGFKYHSIFATSSIKEAYQYYLLFKKVMGTNTLPELKIACLFDPTIDNNDGTIFKEEALVDIIKDYNKIYNRAYRIQKYDAYKKDVSYRLAHKGIYKNLEINEQIDLLIVVDQMLTGFDSKWVNTLYLDKKLNKESIVQAFSRTNRINDFRKPFGIIKYYRYPYTMKRNIEEAFELYSGYKPYGIFVDKLPENLKTINKIYLEIKKIFDDNEIVNFSKLPPSIAEKAKFSKLFRQMNNTIIAAELQGFKWKKKHEVELLLEEETFLILAKRYQELINVNDYINDLKKEPIPFEVDAACIEIDTAKIDADYLNEKFQKWVQKLQDDGKESKLSEEMYKEIHSNFAILNQEEQKIAEMIMFDIKNGTIFVEKGKSFRDYLNEYQVRLKKKEIDKIANAFGCDKELLSQIVNSKPTEITLNQYGVFDKLTKSINPESAAAYFKKKYGKTIDPRKAKIYAENEIRKYILRFTN